MKTLLLILALLVAAVALTPQVLDDTGYITMGYGQWVAQTSLVVFALLLGLGFFLLYVLFRLLGGLQRSPRRLRIWNHKRRTDDARLGLARGLFALTEGRYADAEGLLNRSAEEGDLPALHYVNAARAAQRITAFKRRDRYLELAQENKDSGQAMSALTAAELHLTAGEIDRAKALLAPLMAQKTVRPKALELMMEAALATCDWASLAELLPTLKRRQILDRKSARTLEEKIRCGLLLIAALDENPAELATRWKAIPKNQQRWPCVLHNYVALRLAQDKNSDLEKLLYEAIKQHWSDHLIYLYGLLESGDNDRRLGRIERWQEEHAENSILLLSAGRLCLRAKLWGKAEANLESSLALGPLPETCHLLTRLLLELEQPERAMEMSRRGLELATEQPLNAQAARKTAWAIALLPTELRTHPELEQRFRYLASAGSDPLMDTHGD